MGYVTDFLTFFGTVCICLSIYLLCGVEWCVLAIGVFSLIAGIISITMSLKHEKKPTKPII